ncbi:MAG: RluA family pseudouridine synthase [Alphaproteobacteria bacterium]|nr:RluA family pseudouridine synthase [Alphaproteobacteria bacterium]MBV9694677.1 RluA family pseudouridine synthase [Alphaproteobacteria bacterium]
MAPEQAGLRLDRALASSFADLSRSRIEALIDAGAVTLGGKTIRDANRRVKPGEVYAMRVPEPTPAKPQAQEIPLAIVYEDKDVIVVDKPAGLVVHPAAGNPDGTLVNALIAHCGPELAGIGGEARPGIVHRLDKDTSGLIVAAKDQRAMTSLAKQFAKHTIERAYDAVVWGAPRAGEGLIEGEIGRNPFDRKRMAVLRGGGKQARTRYRLVEQYGEPRALAALIECRLETGRTHQIRVHLTHIGHPLIGDPSYGRARQMPRPKSPAETAAFAEAAAFPRQALHARVLGFQHPSLHKTLRFEAPWPQDFRALVEAFRGLKPA